MQQNINGNLSRNRRKAFINLKKNYNYQTDQSLSLEDIETKWRVLGKTCFNEGSAFA